MDCRHPGFQAPDRNRYQGTLSPNHFAWYADHSEGSLGDTSKPNGLPAVIS